MLITN